jgi:hypothetical protein
VPVSIKFNCVALVNRRVSIAGNDFGAPGSLRLDPHARGPGHHGGLSSLLPVESGS